jgi:hypothetical protein
MTAPVRLLESSRNPRSRELLRAGLRERPRSSALRSTALAVGVSSSVVAASTTATAAASGVTTLAAPNLAMVAAKWLAIGTLGGLGLAGTATIATEFATSREPAPSRAPQKLAAPPTTNHSATAESPNVAIAPTTWRADSSRDRDSPVAPVPPPKSPASRKESRAPVSPVAPSAPASASLPAAQSLSREIALIDGARRSLGSGDAGGSLRQLDEYAALPRTGTLDREAQLLRIDALTQSGQRAAALALAERYLASFPNDPHAARLRTLTSAP